MTDKVVESTPLDVESLAAPEILTVEKEVQPASVIALGLTEERLKELLEAQNKALEETIERRVQSVKDRRFAQLETRLDEALVLKEQVEAAGGWDPYLAQTQQTEAIEKRLEKLVEARLSGAAAAKQTSSKEAWQQEWDAESQKILDAAKEQGVSLSNDEYRSALFNNGIPFGS